MSFKVLIEDGSGDIKVAAEIDDRRVTRVSINSNEGEAGALNVAPNQTEVLIKMDYAISDGRPTLNDVEATVHPLRTGEQAQEAIDRLKELPSATNQGFDSILPAAKEEEDSKKSDTKSTSSSSGTKKAS